MPKILVTDGAGFIGFHAVGLSHAWIGLVPDAQS